MALVSCSFEEPQLPQFETEWLIPLGVEQYTVAELLEDQDGLHIGDDGSLSLRHEGEIDEVTVGDVLDVDVDGHTVDTQLGTFDLAAADPTTIDFTLSDLYPAASGLDGMSMPVPPFQFDLTSPPQDVPQVGSATIASGGLDVRVDNGLPVPVGGTNPPEAILLELRDPAGGVFASTSLDQAIPAGGSTTQFVDLAGTTLPGSVEVHITGGSPGSGGSAVTIDADAQLAITVTPVDLVASSATAEVGPQSFSQSTSLDLPASPQVVRGTIGEGTLALDFQNTLSIPVDVDVTIDAFLDATDAPLVLQVALPAGTSTSRNVDLTQYRLDFDGRPGTEIDVDATVSSPGSGGQEVVLDSGANVRASIAPFTLGFSEVTGILDPEVIDLPSSASSLDLPEELDHIQLAAAELRFSVVTSVGMPSSVDVHLDGTNESGNTVGLDLAFAVPAAPSGETLVHEVIFDGTNSGLLDFLNNLPVDITMSGQANVGDGTTAGTVATDDAVSATYRIDAPMAVSIAEQDIELDPVALELDEELRDQLEDRLIEATLETTVTSTLPIEVSAWIGLDQFEGGVFANPDLLLGPVEVPASVAPRGDPDFAAGEATSQLAVERSQVPALTQPTLYQGVRLHLPGTSGAVVSLRADDVVTVTGFLRARIQIGEDDQ